MFGDPNTVSGGRALKFYSHCQIWTTVGKKIEKELKFGQKTRKYRMGSNCNVGTRKNRYSGKNRNVAIPITFDYGFDNIQANIDFLKEVNWWKMSGNTVNTNGFIDDNLQMKKLVQYIEDNDLEVDLSKVVQEAWDDVEERLTVERKSRY